MGRNLSYRDRLKRETLSVELKDPHNLLVRELREEFNVSRIEAEVLARRSLKWLGPGGGQLPGRVRVEVPATPCMKDSRRRRIPAVVTAVDVKADGAVWREFGLAAMQRGRMVRLLYGIWRQGGWASLTEAAAWLNLTPTALQSRLRPLRQAGLWLPHVGGRFQQAAGTWLHAWLLDRYLDLGGAEALCRLAGLTGAGLEEMLHQAVRVWRQERAGHCAGPGMGEEWLRPEEAAAIAGVVKRRGRNPRWKNLLVRCGRRAETGETESEPAEPLTVLQREHGLSPVAARLFLERLEALGRQWHPAEPPGPGELLFMAISAGEGVRARIAEAKVAPVRLSYWEEEDLALGPRGGRRNCVSGMKWARLVRYATEARQQGGLLTLPDLAMLLGIHPDAVRHLIRRHPEVAVPTRGLVKDMGKGVTHRCRIVELYLQLHTETEIVERSGHGYESVEAYLREFARVAILAGRGLNAVMIRRVSGRSMALVKAYLELYHRYDRDPAYVFRLGQLRRVFAREEADPAGDPKKNPLPFPIPEGRG